MSTPFTIEHLHCATILLVEDHEVCRRITLAQLDRLGVPTIVAADGNVAFQAWLTHRPTLVISDYRLPGLSGHALARQIRAHEQEDHASSSPDLSEQPRTTLILLSATMTTQDIEAGLRAGFDECLIKPLLGSALAQALTRWGVHHEKLK